MMRVVSVRRNRKSRLGISQVEVAVSTVIVGVLMVASLSTIAASRKSQIAESDRVRGLAIAEAMMTEITQLPMRELPCDYGFGMGADELGPNRVNLDDIDDYRDLVDSPPKTKDGTLLTGYGNLSRRVAIDRVRSSNWTVVGTTYEGVYRITIRVLRGTTEVCRLVGYRTAGGPSASAIAGMNHAN